MLQRHISKQLLSWYNHGKKPLLVTGARQVGKTYIVRATFERLGRRLHIFNFEKSPSLTKIFDGDLEPGRLVRELALAVNERIDLGKDILFFDEIQACERALTSLKYFNENLPEAKIIATGSYIGLMQGFPVGKVDTVEMYPMTFEEFLLAVVGEGTIMSAFQALDLSPTLFEKVWPMLLEYFYVGGLPEAVAIWVQERKANPVEGAQKLRTFQQQILANYSLDFGKYSGRNAPHILGVFQNIPHQLAQNIDASVKKYKFKDILPGKKAYSQLEGPLLWLEQMRMMHRVFIIGDPKLPLIAQDTLFKAFMFDMGILSCQLEISLKQHLEASFAYKGYLAENFVALELRASGFGRIHSWQSSGDAEIEFILPLSGNVAVPIEVKSGKRTRSRSLEVYRNRYNPELSIKLIGSAGSRYEKGLSMPLYYAGKIPFL